MLLVGGDLAHNLVTGLRLLVLGGGLVAHNLGSELHLLLRGLKLGLFLLHALLGGNDDQPLHRDLEDTRLLVDIQLSVIPSILWSHADSNVPDQAILVLLHGNHHGVLEPTFASVEMIGTFDSANMDMTPQKLLDASFFW